MTRKKTLYCHLEDIFDGLDVGESSGPNYTSATKCQRDQFHKIVNREKREKCKLNVINYVTVFEKCKSIVIINMNCIWVGTQ